MAPREPTRAQLSNKLSYQSHTPNFLLKMQNKINGIADDEEDYDEEFEHVGGGREPIPRRPRPAIPERPADNPGSEDEDAADEKPQVVVLKEGKHLTEWEAENVRRAEKGLPPLPRPDAPKENPSAPTDGDSKSKEGSTSKSKSASQGLSFSSAGATAFKGSKKRKATSQLEEIIEEKKKDLKPKDSGKGSTKAAKKPKKESKALLSFGDDA